MGFWRDQEGYMQNTPNTPVQNAVDEAYDQYADVDDSTEEVMEEVRVRSEVERRIRKANLYQAILGGELFQGEVSEEAIEVEAEFREFALKRLQIFMGMEEEEGPKVKVQQFSHEEELALKTWAAKLLGKPVSMPPPAPAPEPVKSKPIVAAPPRPAAPEPRLRQLADPAVAAPPKRRPGRPAAPEKTGPRAKKKTVEVVGTKLDGTQGLVEVDVTGPVLPPPTAARAPMPTPEMAFAMEAGRAETTAGNSKILQQLKASKGE